jgi:hypothetical protein
MEKSLMPVREILVYNQPKQVYKTFHTSTNNWKELAELITRDSDLQASNLNNIKAVLQSNKSTLELPDSLIPEGPQRIFLFEAKVKSGAVNYEALSYLELRRLVKEKGLSEGIGANPTRTALVERLKNAAGITKREETKVTKAGKTRTKVVEIESPETPAIKQQDAEILKQENLSLNERVSSMERTLAILINGMYQLCRDFVATGPQATKLIPVPEEIVKPKASEPLPTKLEELDLDELEKEAKNLKVPGTVLR